MTEHKTQAGLQAKLFHRSGNQLQTEAETILSEALERIEMMIAEDDKREFCHATARHLVFDALARAGKIFEARHDDEAAARRSA